MPSKPLDPVQAARFLRWTQRNRIRLYRPYPKQRDFHRLGTEKRERCLLAANQSGKTHCAGCEVGYHLTGMYPEWWEGKRLPGPNRWWVACVSGETTRDNPQRVLLGPPGQWGTGTIPEHLILETKRSRTTSDAVDILHVRHRSGGTSTVTFKSYEQGSKKWQGESLNGGVWFDEEPPEEIYTEGLTRTNATKAMVMMTATPLLGMTRVVTWFYPTPNIPSRALVQMTLEECRYEDGPGHYNDAEIEAIIATYPDYEREARVKGVPMLGSGRIFPVAESLISVAPFPMPNHWPSIAGIDFGWDHPTAAARCTYDKDSDCFYVTHSYKRAQQSPAQHAMTLRHWGAWLPWSWPRDGLQSGESGQQVAVLYRKEGLRMLRDHATFEEGGVGLEAGVQEMLVRMQTGRLKVFDTLEDWFAEFRVYHRKDGKIIASNDDLMAATRYALMMKRFARVEMMQTRLPKTTGHYDPLGGRDRDRYEAL